MKKTKWPELHEVLEKLKQDRAKDKIEIEMLRSKADKMMAAIETTRLRDLACEEQQMAEQIKAQQAYMDRKAEEDEQNERRRIVSFFTDAFLDPLNYLGHSSFSKPEKTEGKKTHNKPKVKTSKLVIRFLCVLIVGAYMIVTWPFRFIRSNW